MRITTFALTIVLLLATGNAYSGELDSYYLEQFGEITSAQSGTSFKATGIPVSLKCGMPLHHGLKRDWSKLSSTTQKTLAKYGVPPILNNEAIVRSNGGHFKIHYATTGTDVPPTTDANGNGVPDWIETVASTFEAVYAREVTDFGYSSPVTPYNIYLQSLVADSEYGYTDTTTLIGLKADSYIVIDNSFTDPLFAPFSPLTSLNITAAHEFHHAIQFGYNYYFETWYAEATSTWMEDEVYDSGNQLYTYLRTYYLQTNVQIDTAVSLSTGGGYGRWSFNRYLNEVFTNNATVRSIWERLATKTPVGNADIPMLPVINETLTGPGSNLSTAFLGFATRFLLNDWPSHQNEQSKFPTLTFSSSNTYQLTSSAFSVPGASISLPNYSFQYLKLLPQTAGQVNINYPAKPASYALFAYLLSSGSFSRFPADAAGNIIIPAVTPADTIYLLICNNVTGTEIIPTEPAMSIPSPGDAINPYPGNVTLITSPPAIPTTPASPGGGGGCFIATAAYGSYLHPKVKLLRDFRDTFLLTNPPGRVLVAAYYKLSPPLASLIAKHETLRFAARILLAPLIFAVEHVWCALAAVIICVGTALLLAIRLRKRQLLYAQAA